MEYKILGRNGVAISSDVSLHPGDVLEMEFGARGLKKIDVAAQLGIKPGHLSELLRHKRHVSAEMALKLEQLLGIDAEFWLRVQSGFDLERARKTFMGPSKRRKNRIVV